MTLHLLNWLPDETLYSLASRWHRLNGNSRPGSTNVALFGGPRLGVAHDLPTHLDDFVANTHGHFGSAESIVHERTLLPFFLPYGSAERAAEAAAVMRTGSAHSIKARLGILASRFGAANPLRACHRCVEADLASADTSFWHRDHQWPGAWVCRVHGTLLKYGLAKVNTSGKYGWWLPADVTFASCVAPDCEDAATPLLKKLAACACGLGRLPRGLFLEASAVRKTYCARATQLGLMTQAGRLRVEDFANFLHTTCAPLSHVAGLETLAARESSLTSQFSRLLYARQGIAHPLRHLVLVTALFQNWDEFLGLYRDQISTGDTDPVANQPTPESSQSDLGRRIVSELVQSGMSVTAAASLCGIAVATAMAWCAQSGMPTARRPKTLTGELRCLAISKLRNGESKQDVAHAATVSVQTVTALLRSEPGLHNQWRAARAQRKQRQMREAWTRTRRANLKLNTSQLRALSPATYAWLHRNDRAWLTRAVAASTRPERRSQRTSVNWEERDCLLAQRIVQANRLHLAQGQRKPLKLFELCNQIPGLKARLSDLDHLPKTDQALSEVLIRRRASAMWMRRIHPDS